MMLLEHDAKTLLAEHGIRCPSGWSTRIPVFDPPAPGAGPWVVKAQVPCGGRGKAGGIALVEDEEAALAALHRILGMSIKGHRVGSCRIESATRGTEHYLAVKLDPVRGQVCCLYSGHGGVEIEEQADSLHRAYADFSEAAVTAAFREMTAAMGATGAEALAIAGAAVAKAIFALEATLVEINPLLILPDGGWCAADAKVVVDLNALPRQPKIRRLIEETPDSYPEASVKLMQEFDFVIIDPKGEIGLITTGAGLSMQVADELSRRGSSVFNFTDLRTGGFRGKPDRLIFVLNTIAGGGNVKAVLINIFAGITHLGEFAQVLVDALKAVPAFDIPIVARLVGNGEEDGLKLLRDAGVDIVFERDLDRALDKVTAIAEEATR